MKVGDKVRLNINDPAKHMPPVGDIGEVTRVKAPDGSTFIGVCFDSQKHDVWYFDKTTIHWLDRVPTSDSK